MTARRIGLVLATFLSLAGIPAALDVRPDPTSDGSVALPIGVLVVAVLIAGTTLALFVPVWRGKRTAATIVASLALIGGATALPAFFAPADVVPPGGVVLAAIGTLAALTAFALLVFDAPGIVLQALGLVAVIAIYAALVALATLVVPAPALRLAQTTAAAACALAYGPLVRLLRSTVGRVVYGGRADPAGTALAVARAREGAQGPAALDAVLSELARSLRLPEITLMSDGRIVATGTSDARAGRERVVIPLDAEGTDTLSVTLRRGERSLPREDAHALGLVALPLVLLRRESTLLAEVRAARTAAATARDREQRNLHRDLHDGLGPLLTGAAMRADAAQNLLRTDAAAASVELVAARSDLQSAIAEVRRVVYHLWPVDLEQRGLWEALRVRAARSGATLSLPQHPPDPPPAIALAAYRIVGEALTNADRHGVPGTTRMDMSLDAEALRIAVVNDLAALGAGAAEREGAGAEVCGGVGIRSMRERAEEQGGTLDITERDGQWQLAARLPWRAAEDLGAGTDAAPATAAGG